MTYRQQIELARTLLLLRDLVRRDPKDAIVALNHSIELLQRPRFKVVQGGKS